MSRSNGQNGQPPQGYHSDAVPHWRHPADPGAHPHAGTPAQPPFAATAHAAPPLGGAPFAPSPDLPPFGQQPAEPSLAAYSPQGQPQGHYPSASAGHYHAPPWQTAPPAADPHALSLGQFGHSGQPHGMHHQGGQDMAPPLPTHDAYGRPLVTPGAPSSWQHQAHTQPPFGSGMHPQDPHHLPSPQAFAEPQRVPHAPYAPAVAGGAMAGIAAAGAPLTAPLARHAPASAPETYDDDEEYEDDLLDDEPKRGRKLMVVGALVGAICVGGGLAYAYKAFSGGKATLATAKQQTAAKAPPAQPQPPKVAAKLPEAVPAPPPVQAVAPAGVTDDGPRRVQTIAVVPPGGQAVAPPQPTPPPTANVMPGMVLDNLPRPAAVPPPPPLQQAAAPTAPLRPSAPPASPSPPVQAATQAPVKAAPPAAQPKITNAAPAPAAKAEPPKKVAVAPVPKAKASDAYSPNAAVTAAGAAAPAASPAGKAALGAGGSNGFVATVLSTQKGRPEAMKAFADLQQKFPDVLAGKPAEVQEKDLGAEKGVWYRAVVGPPGSRAAASEVCTQLKASGYGQCFVSAY